MRTMTVVTLIAAATMTVFAATQFTLFVVQPIGAIPKGATLVTWRLNSMNFIDSADAWCVRQMDNVNLLCRGLVLGKVAKQDVILVRLPYSETLYLWSTGGTTYGR